ncbi:putative ABC transport system substrate-binding protein [Rhizobiales bacterium GAS113]|nr:putative ABC transport system substrate-binding protein [Rhizobiales bacterium GAS113]
MRRREFIALVGGAAAAWPLGALAQRPGKVFRVGLLGSRAVTDDSPFGASLIRGLARHGYALDRNLVFERREAEGNVHRLPQLAAELVASKVDVIVTFGYPAALAVKKGTTLPAVAFGTGDPVGTGLVGSLARPGGNITGISDVSAEVTPKRLELLKQFAPGLRRVAVLWNADDLGMTERYRASEAGARALGVSVQPLGVREPADFEQAFGAMNRDMPDAILMVADALTTLNRKLVFAFAEAHRLPAIYEFDFLVRDGGLMSYGPDYDESLDRLAALIDRILKGTSPAQLPFEQPTLFRFALNLRTAKSIGFETPAELLVRADEIIE